VVVAQYVYGPYGEVRAADWKNLNYPAKSPVGHQGLFFLRLDGPEDAPALAGGATGLYYNRNRWYSPHLGRFLTRDVNETALPILVALAFNGQTLDTLLSSFDAQSLYADGMNLYGYLGSNPVTGHDPLGLYDDSWLDEFIDDYTGHRLYALGTINEYARYASLALTTALDIAGALLGIDVLQSVHVLVDGRGGFWDAMNIVASMNPVGRLGKVGGVVGKTFKWARRGSKSNRLVGTAVEHLFKILPYKEAQKLTKGFNHKIEAHHILEVRHLKKWGRAAEVPGSPAVILPKAVHNRVTQKLRTALPYGVRHEPQEVWHVYHRVYTELGYQEWLGHIERYFR
jgi:RHS repeat-associated protein